MDVIVWDDVPIIQRRLSRLATFRVRQGRNLWLGFETGIATAFFDG